MTLAFLVEEVSHFARSLSSNFVPFGRGWFFSYASRGCR